MKPNKTIRSLFTILGVCAVIYILGLAGAADRVEQIKYNMPDVVYHAIRSEIGEGCSDEQITEAYLSNKNHYDSLSNQ